MILICMMSVFVGYWRFGAERKLLPLDTEMGEDLGAFGWRGGGGELGDDLVRRTGTGHPELASGFGECAVVGDSEAIRPVYPIRRKSGIGFPSQGFDPFPERGYLSA